MRELTGKTSPILRSFRDNLIMFRESTEICICGRQQEEKQTGFKILQTGKYFLAKI
jgi:hypothetical protein